MSKFEIGDRIMGISTDMLGNRIVYGKIIKIIDGDTMLYKPDRLIVENGSKNDIIYEAEAVKLEGFKLAQAEMFYNEALSLEKRAEELREMARTAMYSKNSK